MSSVSLNLGADEYPLTLSTSEYSLTIGSDDRLLTLGANEYPLTLGLNEYPLTLGTNEYPLTLGTNEYPLTVVDGTALQITLGGAAGPTGAAGAAGAAGPNTVSTSTTTNFTGYIYGNGTTIAGATAASTGGNGAADAGKLVKFNTDGGVSFTSDTGDTIYALSVGGAAALHAIGTSGIGVRGESTDSEAVFGDSTGGIGVRGYTTSGIGVQATSVNGELHARFGDTGNNVSFVDRVKGAFGWVRGSFTGKIQVADTLTANRTYTLPNATGTVALIDPSSGTQTFSGAQSFSSTTRPTSSGTGTPASNSLVTQQDVDNAFLDFDTIALRDDFIGGQDGQLVLGQLDWERSQTNGTGNWRTMTPVTGFGVGALFTAAAFKGAQSLQFDVSNVIGGGGFPLSLFTNSSTRIKFRVQFSSLNARIDIGFRSYVPASSQGFESRKLALNYTPAAAAWTPSTVTVLNQFRRPTVANGRKYYASVGGTTGATEPTWPLTVAGTVTDGTVTWTEHGFQGSSNLKLVQHTIAGETAGVVVDTGVAATINTWYVVEGIWVSGSVWRFTINGVSVDITTTGFLDGTMTPYFRIENTDNVANSLSIDYFGLFSRITRP